MIELSLGGILLALLWIGAACQRAERAAMCAYLAARAPEWVPGTELRATCGWGCIGAAHALVRDGLAEVQEYGTPEHRRRRGGRPAFRYRWRETP